MKIFLVNDTMRVNHPGCLAVMEALRKTIESAGHEIVAVHSVARRFNFSWIDDCDAVVANGEGTMHHESYGCERVFSILDFAQKAGRKTYLINSVYQNYSEKYSHILKRLDGLQVREPRSAEFALAHGGSPEVRLDSCVDVAVRRDGYTRVGIGYSDTDETSPWFHRLQAPPIDGAVKNPLDFFSGITFNDLIAGISAFELYITGRHHAVYACALSGTPFIAVPSNTHKIESFIEWTGLPIPIWRNDVPISRLREFALDNRWMYAQLQEWIWSGKTFKGEDIEAWPDAANG